MHIGNLFKDAMPSPDGERFETLLEHRSLVVERIVRPASTTRAECLQPQDEWVLLLKGEATMTVDGEPVYLWPYRTTADRGTTMQVRKVRVVAAVVWMSVAGTALAQNRMPPIPADKVTAEQKESVKEFQAVRGREPFGPFVPLMRSPDLMVRASAMGEYLRYRTSLTPRLSEFVILLTAREWSQQYEWNVHHPEAMKAGVDPKIAQAIADGRRPDGMSDDETLLYDFFMELERNRSISDPTYARMVARFGEKGVMDTIGIVGYYSLLGMVLNTARTPPTPGVAPPLPMLPK